MGAVFKIVMPGFSRASTSFFFDAKQDVDGRDKSGHDAEKFARYSE
jgi:hypothetical protein